MRFSRWDCSPPSLSDSLLGDVGGWQDLDKAIAKFIQAQVTPSHMAPGTILPLALL